MGSSRASPEPRSSRFGVTHWRPGASKGYAPLPSPVRAASASAVSDSLAIAVVKSGAEIVCAGWVRFVIPSQTPDSGSN